MTDPLTVKATRDRNAATIKAAPLTAEQRKEKKEARNDTAKAMAADIEEWHSFTMAKIEELAEKYHKKPRYFQDIFFQGGARLVHSRGTTAWNAFLSKKMDEVKEGRLSTLLLHQMC